jgi:putative endonuclease
VGVTQTIGGSGETAAQEWLENEGFTILARNWRSGRYELDIVARRADTLHFVEVKTRDPDSWETPEDAMTPAKQRAFRHAVQAWLNLNPSPLEPQMDLIAIDLTPEGSLQLRYIPTAVICRW